MSKLIRAFDVFVSSPGDVSLERERLVKIVSALNSTFVRRHAVVLNPIFWEGHVQSSKGTDIQDVINEQVGHDYDVYLGIIWSRIGSETPRGASGTVEEFERALRRRHANTRGLRFMFFTRKGGYPDEVDPKQLAAVQEFRLRLIDEGLLAKPYTTIEEFERVAHQHLHDYLQEQVTKGLRDEAFSTIDLLADARFLIPDLGQRLVRAAIDMTALSRSGEATQAEFLLNELKFDLTRMKAVVEEMEKLSPHAYATLAREILLGTNEGRSGLSKRIVELLSAALDAEETFALWMKSLSDLARASDLDEAFVVHVNKVLVVADRLVSVAVRNRADLERLEGAARNRPST